MAQLSSWKQKSLNSQRCHIKHFLSLEKPQDEPNDAENRFSLSHSINLSFSAYNSEVFMIKKVFSLLQWEKCKLINDAQE